MPKKLLAELIQELVALGKLVQYPEADLGFAILVDMVSIDPEGHFHLIILLEKETLDGMVTYCKNRMQAEVQKQKEIFLTPEQLIQSAQNMIKYAKVLSWLNQLPPEQIFFH